MDKQKVSKFISDPIYAGVMLYAKKVINLTEVYDFVPAISVETFRKINKLDTDAKFMRLARRYHKDENVKANLMRGMVACGYCGEYMSTGLTSKKRSSGEKYAYYYFRCEDDDCKKKNKSVRALVILGFIENYLSRRPFSNEVAYKSYKEEMALTIQQRSVETKAKILSLRTQKNKLEGTFVKTKEFLLNNPDEQTKKHYIGDLEKIGADISAVELEVEKQKRILDHGDAAILTYDNFLELLEKLPVNMAFSKNLEEIDYMVKKIFSNFTVKGNKVVEFTLNKPFDTFTTTKVVLGAR